MNRRHWLGASLGAIGAVGAGVAASLSPMAAWASNSGWPNRPIRMVVPFPAGGSTDMVARYLAQGLGERLGAPVVVDNRAGAAGNIGTDAVAKAAPDGYTIGLVTSGPLVNNKFLYKSMPFDGDKDLTPIALVCEIPMVFVSNPEQLKVRNLKEFVEAAKAKPSAFSVATPGNGTIGHLALADLSQTVGVRLQDVPYRGDTPALTDLLGGVVQAISAPVSTFIPNIQAGKLRGLAVTSGTRFPGLPDVPTARSRASTRRRRCGSRWSGRQACRHPWCSDSTPRSTACSNPRRARASCSNTAAWWQAVRRHCCASASRPTARSGSA
ncbi:Bug family tripartite tricarboxylate transporter substrate binding protein [Variovorax paradoxus]|uniref:Bug family tripartite tricarboxylate transporter substrate binding protein n=1 Tax=Variovorax paradoxus TaxID=34073 RepID=UPI003C6EE783